jgi:hypothetical protein
VASLSSSRPSCPSCRPPVLRDPTFGHIALALMQCPACEGLGHVLCSCGQGCARCWYSGSDQCLACDGVGSFSFDLFLTTSPARRVVQS